MVYQKYLMNRYQNISIFGFDFAISPFDKQPCFFKLFCRELFLLAHKFYSSAYHKSYHM